jgi:DNA-directed RNA polymerase subunit H (RpoH/RPB5)
MSKTYDELLKILDEKGEIPDETAKSIIKEHGALSDEEKKSVAAAIKMKKALTPKDNKKDDKKEDKKDSEEVSMDDYLKALSVLDSEGASKEDKAKAQKAKDTFEG